MPTVGNSNPPLCINIDGPKGSGKSTLVHAIAERYGLQVHVESENMGFTPSMYSTLASKARENGGLISDRGPLSAWIYTFLRNGPHDYGDGQIPDHYRAITDVLRLFDLTLILTVNDDDVDFLRERISDRKYRTGKGASRIEHDDLAESNTLFTQLCHFYHTHQPDIPVFNLDCRKIVESRLTTGQLADFIVACARNPELYTRINAE